MSGELIQFGFEGQEVRVHLDEAGNPWWVLADVCRILELSNPSDVLRRLESDEWITLESIEGNPRAGIPHQMTIVNEKGLYNVIFRSTKPEAKRLKNWVFGEVLPSIRKTGSYSTKLPAVKNPVTQMAIDTLIRLDEMEQRQAEHERALIETQKLALEALAAQQWMTIRQYVAIHQMVRQLPPGTEQQQYGRWLAGYCQEQGLPIYKQESERYKEWTYPVWTIQQTLYGWLARRHGQGRITNLEIGEDGVSWDNGE